MIGHDVALAQEADERRHTRPNDEGPYCDICRSTVGRYPLDGVGEGFDWGCSDCLAEMRRYGYGR